MGIDAELQDVRDVMRARELFPEAVYTHRRSDFRGVDLPVGSAALAGLLPMNLAAEEDLRGDVLSRAVEVLRPAVWGQLAWMGLSWPAVPELNLGPEYARTGVQACFNTDANLEPVTGHTVYVHVYPGDEERARHLARMIGKDVVGPPEHGW
ncbi:hypothetical protein [Streptomyces sp. ID05-47C]|uniref:hypothetical protein n=1 Tax=Streptomyces sp. ID05-47C TaxID=3028665 RepID=UPI0029BCBD3A|nr:hypothetical protein [Streptomyces sp. ID05-47C]MDX3574245.1 hypothetical protein [Streptomyces sp. ID05-47C]